MPREQDQFTPEQEIQLRSLVKSIFVEPFSDSEALAKAGARLGSGEPIAVATLPSLQAELELLGQTRSEERRALASTLSGRLLHHGYDGIFPRGTRLTIESVEHDSRFLFFRSDLSQRRARDRYDAYQALLQAKIADLRQERARLQQAKKDQGKPAKGKAEVKEVSSTGTVRVWALYSFDSLGEQMARSEREKEMGVKVQPIIKEFSQIGDFSDRVLFEEDVQAILNQGLEFEAWGPLLVDLRQEIISRTEQTEAIVQEYVPEALASAESYLNPPGQRLLIPIFVPYMFAPMLFRYLKASNSNLNLEMDLTVPVFDEQVSPPFPRDLIYHWHNRLDDDGSVNAKELLPDEMLTRAIFAEAVGEMYPVAANVRDEDREVSLLSRRYLVDGFSVSEITQLLSPPTAQEDNLPEQINQLKAAISAKDQELQKIKGSDQGARNKRKVLEGEKGELVVQWRRMVVGSRKQTIIAERIRRAFETRIPSKDPDPQDYTDGDRARGFQEAVSRYQRGVTTNPDWPQPDPADYLLGIESRGYNLDLSLHGSWGYITQGPGKVSDTKGKNRPKFEIPVVPIVGQRLLA